MASTWPAGQGGTKEQQDASQFVKAQLEQWGLGSMFPKLWAYIVANGVDDENRLMLFIYEQPEFKQRFPAMDELSSKGRAISPAEYINLEQQYAQIMQEHGLAGTFFDNPGDFTELIRNEVSPNELTSRVKSGYSAVANADPRVREAFSKFFGTQGDTALAAFFLDPERATPKLLEAAKSAEVAGAARNAEFNVSLNQATELAKMGVTYEQALSGFQRMNQARSLFERGIGETAVSVTPAADSGLFDLQATEAQNVSTSSGVGGTITRPLGDQGVDDPVAAEGIAYTFGTDGAAQAAIERRLAQRRATQAETQSDVVDRQGRGALGSAE